MMASLKGWVQSSSSPTEKKSKLKPRHDEDDDEGDVPMSQAPVDTKRKRVIDDDSDESDVENAATQSESVEPKSSTSAEQEHASKPDTTSELGEEQTKSVEESKPDSKSKDTFQSYLNQKDWDLPPVKKGVPLWVPPGKRKKKKVKTATTSKANDETKSKQTKPKEKKPKQGDGLVKQRTKSSYMLYGQSVREQVKNDNPGIAQTEIMKKIGEMWKGLSEEDKRPFVEEAQRLKDAAPVMTAAEAKACKEAAKEQKDNRMVKVRTKSSYMLFCDSIRKETPDVKITELGEKWRTLPIDEKKKFEDDAALLRENAPMISVAEQNKLKQEKAEQKAEQKANKMVKRKTPSAYNLYCEHLRETLDKSDEKFSAAKAKEQWNDLGADVKKPFEEKAAKLKEDAPLISKAELQAEKESKDNKSAKHPKRQVSESGDAEPVQKRLKETKTEDDHTEAAGEESVKPITDTAADKSDAEPSEKETNAQDTVESIDTLNTKNSKHKTEGLAPLFKPVAKAESKKAAMKAGFAALFKPATKLKTKKDNKKDGSTKEDKPTKNIKAVSPSPPASQKESVPSNQKTATPKTSTVTVDVSKSDNVASTKPKSGECDPTKDKYDPVGDANWSRGQPVPYSAMASTFSALDKVSGKLEKVRILRNFLRSVIVLSPKDLATCVFMCTNDLAPAYEGLELGIGDMVLVSAVSQATGRSKDKIKKDMASHDGDLGSVAEASKSNQKTINFGAKPKPLMVRDVFKTFQDIARIEGSSSMKKKVGLINGMLVRCVGSEARFVIRGLSGKLRIGLAIGTLVPALGAAVAWNDPKQDFPPTVNGRKKGESTEAFEKRVESTTSAIKSAFVQYPSWTVVLDCLIEHGLEDMKKRIGITPGIPVEPMLAKPTKGIAEVLSRFDGQKFACEWKYDGERAQVHMLEDGTIKIFSRSSEDNTGKYPDVVARMKSMIGDSVTSFIMDCESVAYDTEKDAILPFQVLSTRKKKDASADDVKVQVCLYPFDLMYLNGESYLHKSFGVRREVLRESIKESKGQLHFATSHVAADADEIAELLDLSIKENCEGLMVKTMDENATYEIAKRSHSWLKLKKDYLDGVGDTLDLVPIGGWHGKGKRAGTFGAFLIACYDPEAEEFQSICKIGTGFSDEDLKTHAEFFKQHIIEKPKEYYQLCDADSSLVPDAWFEPCQVWEVKAADLSISPKHKAAAGIVDPNKGISLRFPRFLRIRDDKQPEGCTSAQQVAEMYMNQDVVKNSAAPVAENDEDLW